MHRLRALPLAALFLACLWSGGYAQDASSSPPPGPCADNTTCADTSYCKETGAFTLQCAVYSCLSNKWTRYGVCTQKRTTPTSPQLSSDCPRNCREKR
jgi:hypothetical protein